MSWPQQWQHSTNVFVSVSFADPGCVSSVNGSTEWLQANIGPFSEFATLKELQDLNPNFSSVSGDCCCSIFPLQTETSSLWFCNCCRLIAYWFPFIGRIVVGPHSCPGGTADAELSSIQWHRPNRPCVWATWGGQCCGQCGRIPHTARRGWKGRLLSTLGEERKSLALCSAKALLRFLCKP